MHIPTDGCQYSVDSCLDRGLLSSGFWARFRVLEQQLCIRSQPTIEVSQGPRKGLEETLINIAPRLISPQIGNKLES